ncbi:MAG: ABC transporter permease [Bacteroidales bacterium]
MNSIIVLRKLKSQWLWFTINILGLSVALASVITITVFSVNELSFDRFHSKADRIYRVTFETSDGNTSMHPARVVGNSALELQKEYPAFEKIARLIPFRKSVVKIGESKFYSTEAFSTDSTFFDVFDINVIVGKSSKYLAQPSKVLVCKSLAEKYFGSIDVIGKTINILNQQESDPLLFTIEGVYEDFPRNSHFHPELLTSFTEFDNQSTWAYTYFLMQAGVNTDELCATIQQKWEKEKDGDNSVPIIHLQKLTDIHLYSNKTREIESNGSIRSLIMLISGAAIILFIALINFINLCRVKFIFETKKTIVKVVNGASKFTLAKEYMLETLLLSVLSISFAILVASILSKLLDFTLIQPGNIPLVILLSLGFAIVIAILAAYPLLSSKIVSNIKIKSTQARLYTIPLLIQFTLSIVALICTFILNRQIGFLNSQHPSSDKSNMIVMSGNPWEAVQRYDLFKEELLKNSSIENVSSGMEEPGGDILDAVIFEMEGVDSQKDQYINIFTADSNFFSSIGVKSIAGTINLGNMPSQEWEKAAMMLSMLEMTGSQNSKEIKRLNGVVGDFKDKYIVNQSALKLFGITNPNDAVGKRFRLKFHMPYLFPEGEIVGVVPDFHYTNLHNEEKPLVIASRKCFNFCFIITFTPGQFNNAIAVIEQAWTKINPDYPFQYEFIADSYHSVYKNEYSQLNLLSVFALISVTLSLLGMYAMASFNMQRRVKEIGIRKVNGARIVEIISMLIFDFVRWVVLAFVIAIPLAYFTMDKWLQNFAYKISLSWWIFAVVGIIAIAVAILTVIWQSWRAATCNPVETLRYE